MIYNDPPPGMFIVPDKEDMTTVSIFSAVTIIVVTIFIATFQNYRIVFLSRYFLCVRNDIFARHLLCKHDRFTTS